MERTFIVLKYITLQKKLIRQAHRQFEFKRRQAYAPEVFERLAGNYNVNQEDLKLHFLADSTRVKSLLEKTCLALIQNRDTQKRNRMFNEDAL